MKIDFETIFISCFLIFLILGFLVNIIQYEYETNKMEKFCLSINGVFERKNIFENHICLINEENTYTKYNIYKKDGKEYRLVK